MTLKEFNNLKIGDMIVFKWDKEKRGRLFSSLCGFKNSIQSEECMVVVELGIQRCKVHMIHGNGAEDSGFLFSDMEQNLKYLSKIESLCDLNRAK
jgi:hypothetical protein